MAHGAGAPEFHLVSSQGANKDSSFLYPQTKGLIEEAVASVGFNRLFIYRPAFLVGMFGYMSGELDFEGS